MLDGVAALTLDLFPQEATHSAGGKVKTALPAGLRGDAQFCGDRNEFRPLLRRWVGEAFPERFVLFCGMNPSTAEAEFNDPTITREWGFTVREGYTGYAKVNVADYRATSPRDLLTQGRIVSDVNFETIRHQARLAALIVLCHGKLNAALVGPARSALDALGSSGKPILCFGTNSDGSPKHPLYLRSTTPLVPFGGGAA